MNQSNIFSTNGLPVGKTLFLAWIVAALLNIQWGVKIQFSDVTPIEFVLQAGVLFGYFMTLKYAGVLIFFSFDSIFKDRLTSSIWAQIFSPLGIIEVITMFLAFIFYSEALSKNLAPIGLFIALIEFTMRKTKDTE